MSVNKERRARAMLLGYDFIKPDGYDDGLFRVRLGPSEFNGLANFKYLHPDTLEEVISSVSEIDKKFKEK